MSAWSPPSLPRNWVLIAFVLWVLWFAYCVVVASQILLGVLPAFVFVALYLGWRVLVALEAIADGLQRIAAERERRDE